MIGAYADPSKVRAEGLHVAGQRFVVLKADERSVYGKSVSSHPSQLHSLLACG